MAKVGESLIAAVGAVSWSPGPIIESIWGLWWAKHAACNAARFYWNSGTKGTTARLEDYSGQLVAVNPCREVQNNKSKILRPLQSFAMDILVRDGKIRGVGVVERRLS